MPECMICGFPSPPESDLCPRCAKNLQVKGEEAEKLDPPTNFARPPIEEILEAVPMLQWRRCHECNSIDIYADNMLPACKCRRCGSTDTRCMPQENRVLHRTAERPQKREARKVETKVSQSTDSA